MAASRADPRPAIGPEIEGEFSPTGAGGLGILNELLVGGDQLFGGQGPLRQLAECRSHRLGGVEQVVRAAACNFLCCFRLFGLGGVEGIERLGGRASGGRVG